MTRGEGPPQTKTLKSTEIARVKRQAAALRANLRKRRERGAGSGDARTEPDDGTRES